MKSNLHWLCLFVIILLAAGWPAAAAVNLKAGYDFSEGSGSTTADNSGNGNTGTIYSATWSSAGFKGNCLDFGGANNYVSASDSSSLDIVYQFTLEAWVRPDTLPASGEWRVINKCVNTDTYMLAVGSNYVRGGFASDEAPTQDPSQRVSEKYQPVHTNRLP
ncbi:MAG: hypothetical protein M1133_02650 [Armatimonadetes bacterium]|nr:hypothetical protein [Armatimonadota bacterium]